MKRIMIIVCACAVAVLGVSPAVHAQTDEATIERALMAASARARDDASVVKWEDDGTRVVLRQGSNGLVCWESVRLARSAPVQRPMCQRGESPEGRAEP